VISCMFLNKIRIKLVGHYDYEHGTEEVLEPQLRASS